MGEAETVEGARHRKMAALYQRAHQTDCPDKFRAIAEWWRLSAEESATPEVLLQYADNQDVLADDMERRPGHYRIKPVEQTCWQWFRLTHPRNGTPARGGR